LFHDNVENDPPIDKSLDAKKVDFLNKKLSSKFKTLIGYYLGNKFYKTMMRKKAVIYGGVNGVENLAGFRGGAIITCNHIHIFDNAVVYLGVKKALKKRFRLWKVVREANFMFPGVIGVILRNARTLPLCEKNRRLTVSCVEAVKILTQRGEKVLIYPEQAMWWNYRKPRPLKSGPYQIASKAGVPVIPCFITLKDSDIIGADGFPVQEFTLNICPVIPPDEDYRVMKDINEKAWRDVYENVYGEKLGDIDLKPIK